MAPPGVEPLPGHEDVAGVAVRDELRPFRTQGPEAGVVADALDHRAPARRITGCLGVSPTLMTRAGTPAATASGGTSFTTTAFAPMCAPRPMRTGPSTLAPTPM